MEVGSAETTLNGGSADPMPVCIGDAQINYFYFFDEIDKKNSILFRVLFQFTARKIFSSLKLHFS